MNGRGPAFLIREARVADCARILGLARELDSINLPTNEADLAEVLTRSERSFRGRVRNRARAVYVLCAEDRDSGQLVATSMIIGKHGTPEAPHYYLELGGDERYSHTLRKMFRHTFLRLRYAMDGPTEIGGLVVARATRGHPDKVGKQISWARFLYLGAHRQRFEDEVIAEMLPPITGDHRNLFWDHYGRAVTGLSFREADLLSIRDKEFIRALFPEAPLYTFLLPEEVRNSIGAVGESTRGAVRLLEQAGMKFINQVDPFDAGPYYEAATDDLEPVRNRRTLSVEAGMIAGDAAATCLIGCEDKRGFRAVRGDGLIGERRLVVAPEVIEALEVKAGTRVDVVPLP